MRIIVMWFFSPYSIYEQYYFAITSGGYSISTRARKNKIMERLLLSLPLASPDEIL